MFKEFMTIFNAVSLVSLGRFSNIQNPKKCINVCAKLFLDDAVIHSFMRVNEK